MPHQIRIEKKSITSKSSSQTRLGVPMDLRTPSGKKLPY